MRVPDFLLRRLQAWAGRLRERRLPDYVIGGLANPYMLRWWVIPRNRWLNIYLHEVIRSDDDRALHDHPWANLSILVEGSYVEHRIAAGGIRHLALRTAGDVKLRAPSAAHRLEVIPGTRAVSLFLTGPVVRHWGFHCPEAGWRHWQDFTGGEAGEVVGRGCGEMDPALATPRRERLFDPRKGRR
jgi:hypothetical protein